MAWGREDACSGPPRSQGRENTSGTTSETQYASMLTRRHCHHRIRQGGWGKIRQLRGAGGKGAHYRGLGEEKPIITRAGEVEPIKRGWVGANWHDGPAVTMTLSLSVKCTHLHVTMTLSLSIKCTHFHVTMTLSLSEPAVLRLTVIS